MARNWENQNVTEINRLPARVLLTPFTDRETALLDDKNLSPFYQTLNGEWLFKYFDCPEDSEALFNQKDGEFTEDDIKRSDVNGDGGVNLKDLLALRRMVNGVN